MKIQGSGRTDGGVHALGQVASLRLSRKSRGREFLRKLNERLRRISVSGKSSWYRIPFMDAEAQRGKCYEYHIDLRKSRVSFQENIHTTTRKLDIEAMREAAGYLIGRHDFSSFTDRKDEESCMQRIDEIRVEVEPDKLYLVFGERISVPHGANFKRNSSGSGSGKRRADELPRILNEKKRAEAGFLAPAQGYFKRILQR